MYIKENIINYCLGNWIINIDTTILHIIKVWPGINRFWDKMGSIPSSMETVAKEATPYLTPRFWDVENAMLDIKSKNPNFGKADGDWKDVKKEEDRNLRTINLLESVGSFPSLGEPASPIEKATWVLSDYEKSTKPKMGSPILDALSQRSTPVKPTSVETTLVKPTSVETTSVETTSVKPTSVETTSVGITKEIIAKETGCKQPDLYELAMTSSPTGPTYPSVGSVLFN